MSSVHNSIRDFHDKLDLRSRGEKPNTATHAATWCPRNKKEKIDFGELLLSQIQNSDIDFNDTSYIDFFNLIHHVLAYQQDIHNLIDDD